MRELEEVANFIRGNVFRCLKCSRETEEENGKKTPHCGHEAHVVVRPSVAPQQIAVADAQARG